MKIYGGGGGIGTLNAIICIEEITYYAEKACKKTKNVPMETTNFT